MGRPRSRRPEPARHRLARPRLTGHATGRGQQCRTPSRPAHRARHRQRRRAPDPRRAGRSGAATTRNLAAPPGTPPPPGGTAGPAGGRALARGERRCRRARALTRRDRHHRQTLRPSPGEHRPRRGTAARPPAARRHRPGRPAWHRRALPPPDEPTRAGSHQRTGAAPPGAAQRPRGWLAAGCRPGAGVPLGGGVLPGGGKLTGRAGTPGSAGPHPRTQARRPAPPEPARHRRLAPEKEWPPAGSARGRGRGGRRAAAPCPPSFGGRFLFTAPGIA